MNFLSLGLVLRPEEPESRVSRKALLKLASVPLLFLSLSAVGWGQSERNGIDRPAQIEEFPRSAFIDGLLPTPTPTEAPTATPTPVQALSLSGHVSSCSNLNRGPVPNVTLDLTGDLTTSVMSGESGNYMFLSALSSGTYTVTPSKAALIPGPSSAGGINLIDVVGAHRHVINIGTPLSGCRLTAADVNGDGLVTTVDVLAMLQFYLGETTGLANVGQYSFTPASRTYSGLVSNQMGQNYEALVFGDVAPPFADRSLFFDPNANDVVNVMVVQADGKILIGGFFTTLSPDGGETVQRNRIARLNADGTLDVSFNPDADGAVRSIVIQPDGKILVGGSFTTIGGQPRNRIARLDSTTGAADSFDPNANAVVFSVASLTDGKILASGWFTTMGGESHLDIARLDAITGVADSFAPKLEGLDDRPSVTSIVVQADGKILLGGYFSSIVGQSCRNIARLNSDGTPDVTFLPILSGADHFGDVFSMAVQPDGKIVLGGGFNIVEGLVRNHIARLDGTTGLPDSFDPNAPELFEDVLSVAVQADGKVLAGGRFTSNSGENSIGGQPRNYIARLDATTGLADSVDPNANGIVVSMALRPDGKILVGGGFTEIGGQTRSYIAQLDSTLGLADRINPTVNSNTAVIRPKKVVVDQCKINHVTAVRAGLKCDD